MSTQDTYTDDDIALVRQIAHRFVRERLVPLEAGIDAADEVPAGLLPTLRAEAHELGLYGFNLPAALGGPGLPVEGRLAVLEELTYTSVPLSEVLGYLPLSLRFCSAQQSEALLPSIRSGRETMTYALTEPGAGSDLSALRTRGQKVAGGWLLNGAKQFISHAETADYIIVLALTDADASLKKRLTTFLIRKGNPGLVGMTRYRKMGWRGYHLNGFTLENCFVPDDDLLGAPGQGFQVMMESINHDRIFSASRSLGLARRAHESACVYAKERKAFGVPIGDHQAIQMMIADNDVEIQAARLLIADAAIRIEREAHDARIAAARAKLYASEMGCRVADRALQIFGGMGYMSELPLERFYRDARAFRIGEGTSEMQRIQIARHALADA